MAKEKPRFGLVTLDEVIADPRKALQEYYREQAAERVSPNGHYARRERKVEIVVECHSSTDVVRLPDGTQIIHTPPDLNSPGQWGKTGQGGGASGGGTKKPNHGSGNPAPTPKERGYMPPQMLKAFDFGQPKYDGKDVIGGGTGEDARHAKFLRLKQEVARQRSAAKCGEEEAKRLRKEAGDLRDEMELSDDPAEKAARRRSALELEDQAREADRRARLAAYQADRLEVKSAERVGVKKVILATPKKEDGGDESGKKKGGKKKGGKKGGAQEEGRPEKKGK